MNLVCPRVLFGQVAQVILNMVTDSVFGVERLRGNLPDESPAKASSPATAKFS
jgi:hypothetical protein